MPSSLQKIDSLKTILDCYSSFGEKIVLQDSLNFHLCRFWRNSIMSPIFINHVQNPKSAISKIDSYFFQNPPNGPFDFKPYFNILTKGKTGLSQNIKKKFEKLGWALNPGDSSLTLTTTPLQLDVPKGFQFQFGRYFDPKIYPHFLNTMKRNFKSSDLFMSNFNKMIRTIEPNVITVLVNNSKGKTIGAGLVSTKNQGSLLFCGSINRPYREKNLWKTLVAARQAVSAAHGSKAWIYTTRNPILLWKGQEAFRVSVFQRPNTTEGIINRKAR